MATEVVSSYAFDEDALGLGNFINETMPLLSEDEIVVYVKNDSGYHATTAAFVRETLTDGSTVVNLVISFDKPNL